MTADIVKPVPDKLSFREAEEDETATVARLSVIRKPESENA